MVKSWKSSLEIAYEKGAMVRVISKSLQVGWHFPLNLQEEAIEVVASSQGNIFVNQVG